MKSKFNRRDFLKKSIVGLTDLLILAQSKNVSSFGNNSLFDQRKSFYHLEKLYSNGMIFSEKDLFLKDEIKYFIADLDKRVGIDKIKIQYKIFTSIFDYKYKLEVIVFGSVNSRNHYSIDKDGIMFVDSLYQRSQDSILTEEFILNDFADELSVNINRNLHRYNQILQKSTSKEKNLKPIPKNFFDYITNHKH